MFQEYFNYAKFWLKSTNAHGVHSPFVYNLVTKCFYKKHKPEINASTLPRGLKKKHVKLLCEVFNYLKINEALFLVEENHFVKQIFKNRETQKNNLYNLVYVSIDYFNNKNVEEYFLKLKKNGVLVVETPYKQIHFWKKIKENNQAQVIVDTYFFGFVFARNTQAKEKFFIRL